MPRFCKCLYVRVDDEENLVDNIDVLIYYSAACYSMLLLTLEAQNDIINWYQRYSWYKLVNPRGSKPWYIHGY